MPGHDCNVPDLVDCTAARKLVDERLDSLVGDRDPVAKIQRVLCLFVAVLRDDHMATVVLTLQRFESGLLTTVGERQPERVDPLGPNPLCARDSGPTR